MKNLKKISREELKQISGGKYPIGYNCTDACRAGDGFCEQYGLVCGLWWYESPDGTVQYSCTKCA